VLRAVLAVAAGLTGSFLAARALFKRARQRAFLSAIRPRVPFRPDRLPPPPDYSHPASWAVTPSATGKSLLSPPGVVPLDPDRAEVDLFFVHPTTYFGSSGWNAATNDLRANEGVDEMVVPGQVTAFNGCARIWVPRYRQATLWVFIAPDENGRRALELAYQDVRRAFRHWLEHHRSGRPFLLASHSQGTLHALRLLEEEILPAGLADDLVAAYLIGYWIPRDKLQALRPLRPAASPSDTRCLIAWDTFGEGGGPDHSKDRGEHFYPAASGGEWRPRAGKTPVCANPLTGACTTEPAPARFNIGAVHPVIENLPSESEMFLGDEPHGLRALALSHPHPGEVGARCGKDGFLYIPRPKTAAFRSFLLPGRSYHNHDYGLFYMNLRADVERRVKAYLSTRGTTEHAL
jgi:hypothetical protein